MKYLMRFLQPLVFLIALLTSAPSWAVQPDEVLSDPALEARARAISKELRCMVCQNESIDDSDAPLAHDLRVLVRERLKAGDSDQQIVNFLVSRYGEFVLLRPPLSWHTAALWGTPPALVLLGIIMIVVLERRRRKSSAQTAPVSLTAAEDARLAEILRGNAGT
jgi:cytochrome c-type biogenesis protein CcmH